MTEKNKHQIKVSFQLYPIVLVLAILKMAGVLNISWWWVFSPFFITIGLAFTGIAFVFSMGMLAIFVESSAFALKRWRNRIRFWLVSKKRKK